MSLFSKPTSKTADEQQDHPSLEEDDSLNQVSAAFIGLSILAHVFFLLAMLFIQNIHFTRPLPPVIQVDLVSFAPEPVFEDLSGQNQPEDEKAVDPETDITPEPDIPEQFPQEKPSQTPVEPRPEKIVVKKPDISLKTKPKNLNELIKSKQAEDKKEDSEPPEKQEDPEPETSPDTMKKEQLEKALSRLERLVQEQNSKKQAEGQDEKKAGPSTGSGKKNYKPIDLYNMVLASAIHQNWVFNERLARMDKNLEARVVITILKNGDLRDIFFETRSGNAYLDETAEKAIRKALPLPELPKGYNTYTVGLKFAPSGLK